MKKQKVDGMWQYEVPDELIKKMFDTAEKNQKNTYPDPNKVSVAVLTNKGHIYAGISYHSDVYTLTMHAEMVALANTALNGEREIVAITGPNCNMCRQLIWESAVRSKIDPIIVTKNKNKISKTPLSEMLVQPWPDREGNR